MSDAKQDAINFCNNMKDKGEVSVEVAAAYLVINSLLDHVDELEAENESSRAVFQEIGVTVEYTDHGVRYRFSSDGSVMATSDDREN